MPRYRVYEVREKIVEATELKDIRVGFESNKFFNDKDIKQFSICDIETQVEDEHDYA